MGMAGYYRVRDQFTFEAQSAQYVQLFNELAPSRKSQAAPPRRAAAQDAQDAALVRPAD